MRSPKNRLRSAMVLGATPAGVAAANKLGELGIPVILVDKDGDLNAKLAGETYRLASGVPLNFAHRPGLIRILRNPDIRCCIPAVVRGAKHSQQGFTVKLERLQTFVDAKRCTLCGKCTEICPANDDQGTKPIAFESRLALPGRAVIDKRREPLCQDNCPLGVNAQGYIALARAGRYAEALDVIRRDNVLPAICGRICHHPCEKACRRADVDSPLAIRDIKRFLADFESGQNPPAQPCRPPAQPARSEKIAVIGSGPAGLAAAADLARHGFAVTIFEKEPQAGGLLRYGIGPHRLPRDILDRELAAIEALGVDLRTGQAVDLANGLQDLKKEYPAVILAVGSWADRSLGLAGEELQGVQGCLSFLQDFYHGRVAPLEHEQVAVIGDGNAAFDLARVLSRLGARVTLISWFPEDMIPAEAAEVEAARAEGIAMVTGRQVTAFNGDHGKLNSLILKPTRPGKPDADGIAWPVLIEDGRPTALGVSRAFIAIGQRGAHQPSLCRTGVTPHGYLDADEAGRTATAGIYAAGDAVNGASSVVQAMARGRAAAASVIADLNGQATTHKSGPATVRPQDRDFTSIDPAMPVCRRAPMPETPAAARQGNFTEVARGYNEQQMLTEAERCLQCSRCSQCLECVKACSGNQAVRHDEPAQQTTENVGVMIIADPESAPPIRGEDVIRAYGPLAAKTDVNAMILRGQAAAAKALVLLKENTGSPKGHGVALVPPDPGLAPEVRMGVFACRCNDALGWASGMDAYIQSLGQRPEIVRAETVPSACTPEGIAHILSCVRDAGLTRVVLASCVCCPLNFICSACTDQRSRLKDGLFNGTGISRSMVQTINLRGEVLRLVAANPDLALERFTGIMDRSIDHAANLLTFPAPVRTYNFTTAVIGRSEAAMTAARTLAEAGLEVIMFGTDQLPLEQAPDHPNIHAFAGAVATTISGTLGNFKVHTQTGGRQRTFAVGAVILGENTRKITLYRPHEGHPGYTVHSTTQKRGVNGTPYMYPGTTSISGLFLADPQGVQISKRTKGAAAAVLAAAVMPRGPRQSRGYSVRVKENLCRSCGRCLEACPYQAIAFRTSATGGYCAEVDEALCKGCGNCISVCPSDAADSPYRDHVYLEQTVEKLLLKVQGS